MKPAILFDLDGTLWNAADGVAKAWNEIIEHSEYPMDRALEGKDVMGFMGWPMDEIGKALFPDLKDEGKRDALFQACTDNENRLLSVEGGNLYPGVEDVLAALKEQYFLGIVSNCQAGYIEAFLHAHHLEDAFDDFLCWADTGKAKEYTIRMMVDKHVLNDVLYIGDIQKDADAAHAAGTDFVLAGYGFGDAPEEDVIDSLTDLPAYAEKWLAEKQKAENSRKETGNAQ